jgi:rhodanese-related sulfurtransferase
MIRGTLNVPGARELAAMGYKNVAHYPEGKQGWMEAGLPMEKAA